MLFCITLQTNNLQPSTKSSNQSQASLQGDNKPSNQSQGSLQAVNKSSNQSQTKSTIKIPGHAERKSISSEPRDQLSSETSDDIEDDFCCERFVKVEVKHVTDGEVGLLFHFGSVFF